MRVGVNRRPELGASSSGINRRAGEDDEDMGIHWVLNDTLHQVSLFKE